MVREELLPVSDRSRVWRIERMLDGRSKGRQVIGYGVPDRFEIYRSS